MGLTLWGGETLRVDLESWILRADFECLIGGVAKDWSVE